MKTLIVGMGEIGTALYDVLVKYYLIETIDDKTDENKTENVDIMHIAFPYSNKFEEEVSKYQQIYNPQYTVIHSTVPVGVSRKLNAIHSPVRGKHPYLRKSLLTFEKMIGGENADEVADYFRRVGMRVLLFRKQESTELAKLLDTLYYGVCIEYAKEVEKLCEKYNVPFSEVYVLANKTYNEGYTKMNNPEYVRPVLQPLQKRIGGHCVVENTHLLKSNFSDFIKNLNITHKS
jgi:UDP-N-acetyl-D-mannosaminuronate dehydrogenase